MAVLKNIEITQQELKRMRKKSKIGGSEAEVWFLRDNNGKSIARKIFKKDMGCKDKTIDEQEKMRENKRIKVTTLANLKTFDNEIKILRTISCNGQFVGYDTTRNPRAFTLHQLDLSKELFTFYMNKVKNQLQGFHEQDIVYGDISTNNILIDLKKRKVSFCDLDNMQVLDYPIDFETVEIYPFMKKGMLPETVDAYTLNLMILEMLSNVSYDTILYQLKKNKLPKGIVKQGIPVLKKMAVAAKIHYYDGDDLIPYIKKK